MEIIKEGKIQIKFECNECGCIFKVDKSECKIEDVKDNCGISWATWAYYHCPTCKKLLHKSI